jgi:hypothetical protein
MNTDRELLELAAKAAGLRLWPVGCAWREGPTGTGLLLESGRWVWNPLTSDGDALRLAVGLELDIEFDYKADGPQTYVTVVGREVKNRTSYEHHGEDKHAATRRAIVRAAAEIGKASL